MEQHWQTQKNAFAAKELVYYFGYLLRQGCQIFLGTAYPNGKNIPNDHKIYQTAIQFSK
jgi:hypothetical protein